MTRTTGAEPGAWPAWEWWLAGSLVLLGLALRVIHVLAMQDNPYHHDPVMDSAYHVEWARSIAAGEPFGPLADRPFFRAPLYVWLLAGSFAVFGDSLLAPRLLQCILGAGTVGLVYLIGRRAFGRREAAIGALVAATYWVLVYYDGELLIPTLAVPLYLLGLWLTLGLASNPRPGPLVLTGLVWGLSALARPNVLLFLPFLAVWLLWVARPTLWRGLRSAALFAVAVLAPILPVTAHNTFAKGDFVLISSQGGVNFWIGNNPYTDGYTAIVPGTRAGWWEGYHDSINLAEQAEGRPLRASEVSRHYAGRAWTFIRSEPARSLPLLAEKLRLFFTAFEYANNQDPRFFAHHYSWVPRLSIGFAVLAPLGLLGFALCAREPKRLFPLWGFVAVYTLSVVAFFVNARFRVPVLPVLMILGAHAVVWGFDQARAGRWGRVAAGGLFAVGFGIWSTLQAPPASEGELTALVQLGVAEGRRGDLEASAGHFERALEIDPDHVGALTNLGKAERLLGRQDEALTHFARAVELAPLQGDALEWQLEILIERSRMTRAEAVINEYLDRLEQSGVEQQPEVPYYHLGRVYASGGRHKKARAAFVEAQRRDPRSIRAAIALGDLAGKRGAWLEARDHYERAISRLPEEGSAADDVPYARLVHALEAADRDAPACRHAREWLRRRPDLKEARDTMERSCGGGIVIPVSSTGRTAHPAALAEVSCGSVSHGLHADSCSA